MSRGLTRQEIAALGHVGCNVSTCPNGKCRLTGECQDAQPARPMTGFFDALTSQQKSAALAYDGPENHGSPAAPPHPATKDTNPKDAIGDKKVPLWLCSPIAKAHWAVAQFVGMVKYGAWNWRSAGIRSSVYLSAMQRHLDAYMSGEECDPIDETSHLGHIMACAAIIIDAKAAGKLNDDRPPSVSLRAAYAEAEKQMALARENYGHMTPKHYTISDTAA